MLLYFIGKIFDKKVWKVQGHFSDFLEEDSGGVLDVISLKARNNLDVTASFLAI